MMPAGHGSRQGPPSVEAAQGTIGYSWTMKIPVQPKVIIRNCREYDPDEDPRHSP